MLDFKISEDIASDMFFNSKTFAQISDDKKLHNKSWQNIWQKIYKMLKKELQQSL
jgi:predicted kinase